MLSSREVRARAASYFNARKGHTSAQGNVVLADVRRRYFLVGIA